MDLSLLIEALTEPAAYPFPVDRVEVRQTHISAVFLAGDFVYKVKKPVNLGFVDFSTLDRRLHFCQEEVRLNRRLAPEVYLGVVPITQAGGRVTLEGQGPPVEWAVKMQRLPEHAAFHERLRRGTTTAREVESLARRIASFHQSAASSSTIAQFGRFEAVARNLRDIWSQSLKQVGLTVHPEVFEQGRALHEQLLNKLAPMIDSRAARGLPRDTHGDLHLDHVYLFPERQPPNDLVIVDCIEFNDRFRFLDPVADMAFPYMDLKFHGRRDLAEVFANAYFSATGDSEGRGLLPLYTAYRASVRGSVQGIQLEGEPGRTPDPALLQSARAYWLLTLGELAKPVSKPCLILATGLPGTGKSTLARQLADQANGTVIRTDVVRKQFAADSAAPDSLYSEEWNCRTYDRCQELAEALLFQGKRVVVDGTFRENHRRLQFLELARRWAVPAVILVCQARPETVRPRLAARQGDASDADWRVYSMLARRWEEPGPDSGPHVHELSTEGTPDTAAAQALAILGKVGLI